MIGDCVCGGGGALVPFSKCANMYIYIHLLIFRDPLYVYCWEEANSASCVFFVCQFGACCGEWWQCCSVQCGMLSRRSGCGAIIVHFSVTAYCSSVEEEALCTLSCGAWRGGREWKGG